MVALAVAIWAIANLLHPIFLSIWWDADGSLAAIIIAFLYSIALSIPSLLISILVLLGLKRLQCKIILRYLLWLLSTPCIVFLNIQFFYLLLGGAPSLDPFILEFGIPPAMGAFISSLICGSYFFKKMQETDTQPENEREVL